MTTLSEKLHKWATEELNLVTEAGINNIPSEETLRSLTEGKHKKVWNFVVNHVRSQSAVQKVKSILSLKKQFEQIQMNSTTLDQESSIAELHTRVSKANERHQFLKQKLQSIEENILLIQHNSDKLNHERQFVLHKAALLDAIRKHFNNKMGSVNNLNQKLLFHKSNLEAYQSFNQLSVQSEVMIDHRFLHFDKITANFQLNELNKIVCSIIEKKLLSDINNALFETFRNNYRELQKKDFLLTDLLDYLNTTCNSEKQCLMVSMLNSTSVNEFMSCAEKYESVKQNLCQLKFETVQYSLCALRNKKKKNDSESVLVQLCGEIKESNRKDYMDSDFEFKYALVEVSAENEALAMANASLEKNIKEMVEKAEMVSNDFNKGMEEDLIPLTENFYKKADITFYLLNTASDAFNKLLSCVKDLQTFIQDETFQQCLSVDLLHEIKDKFSMDRKLMWDFINSTNIIYPVMAEPYDIKYPLPPESKTVLPLKPYENFSSVCESLISLKNEIKFDALTYSKSWEQIDLNALSILEKIKTTLNIMNSSIHEGEVCLNDAFIGCEQNKRLIEEWWEQKAQYIPKIIYDGKSLKMWIDILHALDDFVPVCKS